jgi:hypothetical protein
VSPTARRLVLVVLLVAVIAALLTYLYQGPRLSSVALAGFLILIWMPVKGLVYRRLGGVKPYWSALAANGSSELTGLPFRLGLGFWPLMGTSFLVSALIETLALVVMGTAPSLKRSLVLAFYGSLVVHLITAGWFYAQRSPAVGVAFIVAGVALLHVPTFFPDEWIEPGA